MACTSSILASIAPVKSPPGDAAILSLSDTEVSSATLTRACASLPADALRSLDRMECEAKISDGAVSSKHAEQAHKPTSRNSSVYSYSTSSSVSVTTPKRPKMKNVILPPSSQTNRGSLAEETANVVHTPRRLASATSGNAVTPSTRGGSTPGTTTTTPDSTTHPDHETKKNCSESLCEKGNSAAENMDDLPEKDDTENTCGNAGDHKNNEIEKSYVNNEVKHETLSAQISVESAMLSSSQSVNQSTPPHMKPRTISSSAPTINLGPRTGARTMIVPAKAISLMPRKASSRPPPGSPVIPRRLDSVLGQNKDCIITHAEAGEDRLVPSSCSDQDRSSSPGQDIPPPSHFLAAKISPLRSSSRLKKSESKTRDRDITSTPSSARETTKSPTAPSTLSAERELPDITDARLLSPCGLFLSPRTPKPNNSVDRDYGKSSACLTPSNFASDFGKGNKQSPTFDASNVFAWLNSPSGQGLFSPNGGLTTLSATNTPRGMYGFFGGSGKTPRTPSTNLAPSSTSSSSFFFSDVEGLPSGGPEISSPKASEEKSFESNRSMICISPLASQRKGDKDHKRANSAPETPINFSEVFASPRFSTPRWSRTGLGSAKKDNSSHPSPVVSALHTAERDILEDEDLNEMLQLAGTTTPGSRPSAFKAGVMSPLLMSNLRKGPAEGSNNRSEEPPSSLQLPIICGSSASSGPKKKLLRKDSSSAADYISPPRLSLRSSSSGILDSVRENSPRESGKNKTSKKNKSKKRKVTDIGQSQPSAEAVPLPPSGHHHHQGLAYPHPNVMHYRHHPPSMAPPLIRHGSGVYYHQAPRVNPYAPQHEGGKEGATDHGTQHSHQSYAYHHHPRHHPIPPGHIPPHHHVAYSAHAVGHHYVYPEQSNAPAANPPKKSKPSKPSKGSKRSGPKDTKSSSKTNDCKLTTETKSSHSKKSKKSSSKSPSKKSKNPSSNIQDPEERARAAAAIRAVNEASGGKNDKAAELAAAILRGVTMRPSGKWQAQLYYSGKSRYIGVFDTREKAALAYEIAREVLKSDKESGPLTPEETERNVNTARKAAFAGVSENDARPLEK